MSIPTGKTQSKNEKNEPFIEDKKTAVMNDVAEKIQRVYNFSNH